MGARTVTGMPDGAPWSATVTGDRQSGRLQVTWRARDVEGPVEAWDVALGWGTWRMPWPTPGGEPAISVPWRLLAAPVDCRVLLEVTAHLGDGTVVGPRTATLTIPPWDEPPPSTDWGLGPPEVVVDDATRVAAGRRFWPDGTLGFASTGDGVLAWAPDGRLALTPAGDPSPGAPADVLRGPESVAGLREPADYAAGGPVIDVGDGVLAMVWHGEVHVGGDPDDFWGFLGLARSTDGGETFHDLGRIVTPHMDATSPRRRIHAEVGGGPCAVADDGHLHVYYRDTIDTGRSAPATNLSVARCPLDEVRAAVHAGRTPTFTKRHEGVWSQPGIGGRADDLLPGASVPRWFGLVRHDQAGWLLVTSGGLAVDWRYVVRTSADGLTWAEGEALGPPWRDEEVLYLTLTGTDLSDPGRADGDVWLWRTRCAGSATDRWEDARLERLTLRRRA